MKACRPRLGGINPTSNGVTRAMKMRALAAQASHIGNNVGKCSQDHARPALLRLRLNELSLSPKARVFLSSSTFALPPPLKASEKPRPWSCWSSHLPWPRLCLRIASARRCARMRWPVGSIMYHGMRCCVEEEARAPYFSLFFSFSSSRAIHIASYKLMLAELVRRLSAADLPMARTSDVRREMAVEPRLRGGSAMPASPAVGLVCANLGARGMHFASSDMKLEGVC